MIKADSKLKGKITKWGGSYGFRIPKKWAEVFGIKEGDMVVFDLIEIKENKNEK